MERKQVLVVGWYGSGNVGDEEFIPAFRAAFPKWSFGFINHFSLDCSRDFSKVDAVIFGGGSFLDEPFDGLPALIHKPIAFVSADDCLQPHKAYMPLLKQAKALVFRDRYHPDITFALTQNDHTARQLGERLIFIPNEFWVPRWNDPKYKHVAWEWTAHELAGLFDKLIRTGYEVSFVSMGSGHVDDRRAGGAILSLMEKAEKVRWDLTTPTSAVVRTHIENASIVLSGRYHGCVFAAQQGVPFLAINSHDKFTTLCEYLEVGSLPYFGFRRDEAIGAINALTRDASIGEALHRRSLTAKIQWIDISERVAKALFG